MSQRALHSPLRRSRLQALLRAHAIETGKIFIDATVDLCKLDPKAARSMFGVITQTPFLFSGTIRENLRMGDDTINDDEIRAVLTQAGLGRRCATLGEATHVSSRLVARTRRRP